jgi:hypothetical protein
MPFKSVAAAMFRRGDESDATGVQESRLGSYAYTRRFTGGPSSEVPPIA